MLEFCWSAQVVSLFLLLSVVPSTSVQEGNGSVVPRDTDKVSALRSKIKKLNDLLSTLGEKDGDEYDLLKVSEQKGKNETPAKPAVASEDMGSYVRSTTFAPKTMAGDERKKQSLTDDSSIQILSKALAKLREPKFNIDDSTGEYLGTDNNDSGSDDKKTRDMEDMITRALIRLSQDKSEDTQHKSAYSDQSSKLPLESRGQSSRLNKESMRAVESQLLKVLFSAKKLGISVSDIIQDLDEKVSKEEKLYKIEEELDALSEQK